MSDNDFSYHSAEDAAGLRAGVAIFADRAGVRHEMAEDMEAAGFRVLRSAPLQELLEGEATSLGDVVLLDCVSVDVKLCAALSRLDMRIARSGAQLIVTTSLDALDEVFACFDQSAPQILVDASRSERVVAVGRTLGSISGGKVRELSEADRLALLRLSEQVDAIAQKIEGLSNNPQVMAGQSGGDAAGAGERSVFSGFSQDDSSPKELRFPNPSHVRRIITERQARAKFFDAELFADPAWDMLLDLTAAHGEGVRVSVTSLCIASGVPPTTALRWVRQMTENGLFERIDDPSDKRRAFISLSAKSRDAMSRYFALIEAPLAAAA